MNRVEREALLLCLRILLRVVKAGGLNRYVSERGVEEREISSAIERLQNQ